METEHLNIYESALMDIGKRNQAPAFIQQLFNTSFQEIWINHNIAIIGIESNEDNGAIHCLKFTEHSAENFQGTEFVSDNLLIVKYLNNDNEEFFDGTINITYHQDLNEWTCFLHIQNKEENRLIQIHESDLKIIG